MAQAPPAVVFKDVADPETIAAQVIADTEVPPLPLPHEMIRVTRDVAAHFLLHVARPRDPNEPAIEQYKRDMVVPGRWRSRNSECLSFSTPGVVDLKGAACRKHGCAGRELVEGRLRLEALIRAIDEFGIPGLWLEFAFDVDPDDMDSLDSGRNRSDADRRKISGGDYPTLADPVVRRIVSWTCPGRAGAPFTGFNPSPAEIRTVLNGEDRDLVIAAAQYGKAAQKRLGLPASMLGFAYWLFHKIDPEMATEFLTQIDLGLNLAKNSPAYLFRDRAARAQTSGTDLFRGKRAIEYRALAVLCLAWNELRAQVAHAKARVEATEQGRKPPRARTPYTKLQLPDGKLTAANFPLPK